MKEPGLNHRHRNKNGEIHRKHAAGPKVVGVTKDGVRILKPKGKATHFTPKELRDAVATARASKRA